MSTLPTKTDLVGNPTEGAYKTALGLLYDIISENQSGLAAILAEIVSVATANKLLLLNANGKLPADITGSSASCTGNAASATKFADGSTSASFAPSGFGLGGSAIYVGDNVDLNGIYKCGAYYFGANQTNRPCDYGTLWVLGGSSNDLLSQIVISPAAKIYTRQKNSGTWTAWKQGATIDQISAYVCKAWVRFNGSGTPAITASGNVTSITDLGVGYFQINFTTALSSNSYVILGIGGNNNAAQYALGVSPISQSTTAAVINTWAANGVVDLTDIHIGIFA
jgi:hypothetical protein